MFPVVFAIPRTSGWMAQWLEMLDDPEQKIARPRQIYTGAHNEPYVPVEDRGDAEPAHASSGPPSPETTTPS
jgi:citrate synthase